MALPALQQSCRLCPRPGNAHFTICSPLSTYAPRRAPSGGSIQTFASHLKRTVNDADRPSQPLNIEPVARVRPSQTDVRLKVYWARPCTISAIAGNGRRCRGRLGSGQWRCSAASQPGRAKRTAASVSFQDETIPRRRHRPATRWPHVRCRIPPARGPYPPL